MDERCASQFLSFRRRWTEMMLFSISYWRNKHQTSNARVNLGSWWTHVQKQMTGVSRSALHHSWCTIFLTNIQLSQRPTTRTYPKTYVRFFHSYAVLSLMYSTVIRRRVLGTLLPIQTVPQAPRIDSFSRNPTRRERRPHIRRVPRTRR
jgi:hypothetical protein